MFGFAAVVLPAALVNAALPGAAQAPARASLAGQVLIASPAMGDPRFERTVILMVQHDQRGAFGIVINRPLGEHPLARILNALGDKDAETESKVRIFEGGPVQPQQGFVIHSADYRRSETIDIDGRLAMTSSRDILRDIANGKGPQKALVAFGYAGWGPGQLEDELQRLVWITAHADLKLIFDDDRDAVWDNAMARRSQEL